MADNQTMQPSGEVGRFEVVDLPSPPADRQRYLPMNFESFDISTLSEIKATFACAEHCDTYSTILLAAFNGHAFNSHEQSCYRHIEVLMAANMVAIESDAVILDFTNLKYEWGDEMAGVLFFCSNHPTETGLKIPVAVITSVLNCEGLTSLVRDEMLESTDDWLFADLTTAVDSLQRRLASRQAK